MPPTDPHTFLPLTPVVYDILLSLAEAERHGYAIMQEVSARSGVALRAGSLYRALARVLDAGFVVEADERPAPDLDDERRRYYRLTPLGRAVVKAESRRLSAQVAHARRLRLLKGDR